MDYLTSVYENKSRNAETIFSFTFVKSHNLLTTLNEICQRSSRKHSLITKNDISSLNLISYCHLKRRYLLVLFDLFGIFHLALIVERLAFAFSLVHRHQMSANDCS